MIVKYCDTENLFSANGAISPKPGASPRHQISNDPSAESANQLATCS